MKGIIYSFFVIFVMNLVGQGSFSTPSHGNYSNESELALQNLYNETAPSSLQDSIRRALINNPITNSNQKLIEAQELSVKALKQSQQLPTLSSSYTISRSTGDRLSTSQNLFIGLNLNIFRGGADKHREKAAEASVLAQKARIHSTDILLPDTNGHLASNVFSAFLSITTNNEGISLSREGISLIEEIYPYFGSEDQLQLQTQLNNLSDNIRRQETNKFTAINDFIHHVHESPSVNIQSLEELRLSLEVPGSAEESVNMGLTRSPTIVALNYDLEASRHSYRADSAVARSPRIDISAGRNIHHLRSHEIHTQNQANIVALTLNYSWHPSTSTYLEATSKRLEATIHRLDSEKLKITHRINSLYNSLINTEGFISSFEERALNEREAFDLLAQRLRRGDKVNIQTVLDKFIAYMNAVDNWTHYTIAAINYRFALQQTIGTLFENVDVSMAEVKKLQELKSKRQ